MPRIVGERLQSDLYPPCVQIVWILHRPRNRSFALAMDHLRSIQLLAAFLHPDAIGEVGELLGRRFSGCNRTSKEFKCPPLKIEGGVLS
jgi:hypothetical protein